MNAIAEPTLSSPNIVHGLDIDVYHAGDELSKTGMDVLARSPAHYYAEYLDPARPPKEDDETVARLVGHLAHCAILEPAEFEKRYVALPPDAPRRPTSAQWNAKNPSPDSVSAMNWWREWQAANQGRTVITHDQLVAARAQSKNVRALTNVYGTTSMADILARGWSEVSAYWTDTDTGVRCRCRPDFVHPLNRRQVILLDVKTFSDAREREFSRQVSRMRYHVQDAFYSEGFAQASGLEVVGFIFVVVEDKYPFAAASYQLGTDSKYEGFYQFRHLLDVYAECQKTGVWPGYSPHTTVIDMPTYALTPQEIEISYV